MSLAAALARRAPGSRVQGWCDLGLQGLVLAVGCLLKCHYSSANADGLNYVLGPTAALVGWITGTQLAAEAGAGYLSHELSILIAPSCAGVNFLVIAWCMLGVGFVRQLTDARAKLVWLVWSAALAYGATIVVNATRIIAGAVLRGMQLAWMPAEQAHRVEGVVIYLTALLLLFALATSTVRRWPA